MEYGGEDMSFTYTEKNGKKPIAEWLVPNLKIYAEKKHGVKLNVEITSDPKPTETTSKS